jgi:poly-gamma-glutamate synthesis protein (capsule biosynthesis protein)
VSENPSAAIAKVLVAVARSNVAGSLLIKFEFTGCLLQSARHMPELALSLHVSFKSYGIGRAPNVKPHPTIFLCGDVMTGRGIDQALSFPGDPRLYEPSIDDAQEYVKLAERANGALPRSLGFDYIWGDTLEEFARETPDAKIINLETAITARPTPWPAKDVHYKMNPMNLPCLTAAAIDCCVLANNHMLDWGIPGLLDTLDALDSAAIKHCGAGRDIRQAQAPAILRTGEHSRAVVFSLGSTSSGIPEAWLALENSPGLNLIETQSHDVVRMISKMVRNVKKSGDTVVVSIHWGSNWGYTIPDFQRVLAHRLVNEAEVNIIHGHSSHHVKGIEVYKGSLILYGCGDFLDDYEGIGGYERFRGDLGLMYFADVDSWTGRFVALRMVPTQTRRFRANRASKADADWLQQLLNREGKPFGTRVEQSTENLLGLEWS